MINKNIYVTVNMCNQGIRVFPGFVKQLLHIFTKLKSVNMCNGSPLKYHTRNKQETSHINLTI